MTNDPGASKSGRVDRLTKAERRAWWADRAVEVDRKIGALVKQRRLRAAIMQVFLEMAAASATHASSHDDIEERLAAVERIVKPRKRMKAGTRRMP